MNIGDSKNQLYKRKRQDIFQIASQRGVTGGITIKIHITNALISASVLNRTVFNYNIIFMLYKNSGHLDTLLVQVAVV